jgi:cell wall-associated NlpC family hydrolase
MLLLPKDIVNEAKTYLGVPFAHQGRSRYGIDCVGLPICILNSLGYFNPPYNFTKYARDPNPQILYGELKRLFKQVPIKQRREGDLLTFSLPFYPCHIAIYTGREKNTIIHAYLARKRVVETNYGKYWQEKVHACFRIPIPDPEGKELT